MDAQRFFSEQDLERIKAAVGAAERRTGGEIVPYAVVACDDYLEASWKAATIGALTAALAAAVVYEIGGFWGHWILAWIAAPAALGAALGYLVASLFPALKRALIPADELDGRVALRAAAAFVEQEVFATRDRSGILILLALFEHRVVVLGDSGINQKVETRAWDAVVAEVVAGIKAGRTAEALIAGIGRCGELLEHAGVARRPDDSDELSDDLRLRGE